MVVNLSLPEKEIMIKQQINAGTMHFHIHSLIPGGKKNWGAWHFRTGIK